MPTAVRYGAGCTWIDYDRDGRLDLLVARYLDTTIEKLPKPGESSDCRWKGVPVNCGPRGLPTGFVQLFHNNGDGTFTDVSQASGVAAAAKSYPMTTVVADYDDDGWPDIYVACDSTPSWLFRNQRDGTFREEALERGVALSEDGLEQAGMGIATGDFDLDGRVDLFKTHFADDTNGLYRGDGKGFFDDVTIRAGIGVETRYVGWGAGHGRSRQRRPARPVHGHRRRLPGGGAHAAGLSVPDAAPGLPQPGQRPLRGADRGGRARRRRRPHQPRVRLRRLRQRRRRRRARLEHERAAVAPAQRRLRRLATG